MCVFFTVDVSDHFPLSVSLCVTNACYKTVHNKLTLCHCAFYVSAQAGLQPPLTPGVRNPQSHPSQKFSSRTQHSHQLDSVTSFPFAALQTIIAWNYISVDIGPCVIVSLAGTSLEMT